MDIREIDVLTDKSDYANICDYIKQVEAINLHQLYRALSSYLSILTLPSAEQYLTTYQEHLADPYSWLAKAYFITQAEAQREFARGQAQAAGTGADFTLWDDVAKKLNYLIEGWDVDIATASQQIIQGISMLINENIPLSDVHGEIIEFAQGRGVSAFDAKHEDDVAARLKHLRSDAWVNSVTALVKLARTVTVQAELFLNRLTQAGSDLSRLEVRQAFLFAANHKLCVFIDKQARDLREVLNHFPAMLAARMIKRLERVDIDAVLQHYNNCVQSLSSEVSTEELENEDQYESEDRYESKIDSNVDDELETYEEKVIEPVAAPRVESVVASVGLEQMLASNEELLEVVIKQISLHRLQLSCSSRIKACYGKFSLFPVFRQISTKLTHHQKSLADSIADLVSADQMADLAEEGRQKFHSITGALENSSKRIGTYLSTLNVHHVDYDVLTEIPNWQRKLHHLILNSSEEELLLIDSRLQRIEALHSPYLRATLIMKLHVAKLKLNDLIVANMQSWSSRIVDRETVENTLSYLGIRVQHHHLNKIAPNIRVIKKKEQNKAKDFYSNAADYGVMAFKKARAWLDKRAII